VPLPPGLRDRFVERGDGFEAETDDVVRLLHELTSWAMSNQLPLDGLQVTQPTLEDVYLSLVAESPA